MTDEKIQIQNLDNMEEKIIISLDRFRQFEAMESLLRKEHKIIVSDGTQVIYDDEALKQIMEMSKEETDYYLMRCEAFNTKPENNKKGFIRRKFHL
jgi:hypothetical protein